MGTRVAILVVAAACGGGSSHSNPADAAPPDAPVETCAPTSGGAICSSDHVCWDDPQPQGAPIFAISGRECDTWIATDQPYLLRLNGGSLSRTATPDMYGTYTQIAAFASYDVWTASRSAQDGFEHFDGQTWTVVSPKGYDGLWGTAPNDLWLVTDDSKLQHWDGTTVTDVPTPGPTQQLMQLAGSSASDVWVVATTPLHYDGTSWMAMPAPGGYVLAMWGTGPTNWYAAGALNDNAVIWHWDGTAWTMVYTTGPVAPYPFAELDAIGGTGPDDVWAGGSALDHLAHFDGTSWTDVAMSGPRVDIHAIQAIASNDLLIGGAHGYLARWDGATLANLSQWTGATADWKATWGTSASNVWMFGNDGTTHHYDGTSWTASTIPGAAVVWGASGTGPADLWVAGSTPTNGHASAFHWNGSAWTGTDLGVAALGHSIWAAAADDVWLGAAGGHAFHWNGSTWTETPTGITDDVFAIWGTANDAWATGKSLIHWNGTVWTVVTSPSTVPSEAVWGRAADDVYLGDIFGNIYHWDGSGFTALATKSPGGISSIGGDATRMWVVSGRYVLLDDGDGGGLRPIDSQLDLQLYGAYFPSATEGWIGGYEGARLHYRP